MAPRMTDATEPPTITARPEPDEDDGALRSSPACARTRKVLWIAVAVAVPVALLVIVLANGQPAATRAVKSPLVGKPAPAIEGTTVDGDPGLPRRPQGQVGGGQLLRHLVRARAARSTPSSSASPRPTQAAGDAAVLGVIYSDNAQAVKEFRDKEGGGWAHARRPQGPDRPRLRRRRRARVVPRSAPTGWWWPSCWAACGPSTSTSCSTGPRPGSKHSSASAGRYLVMTSRQTANTRCPSWP